MNEIYIDVFGDHRPARSAFAVAALPFGALVEVEAWARSRADEHSLTGMVRVLGAILDHRLHGVRVPAVLVFAGGLVASRPAGLGVEGRGRGDARGQRAHRAEQLSLAAQGPPQRDWPKR